VLKFGAAAPAAARFTVAEIKRLTGRPIVKAMKIASIDGERRRYLLDQKRVVGALLPDTGRMGENGWLSSKSKSWSLFLKSGWKFLITIWPSGVTAKFLNAVILGIPMDALMLDTKLASIEWSTIISP
jgi:hypothetical protein